MVHVHVADHGDVDAGQLRRLERRRRFPGNHQDRPAQVRIGEHRAVADAEEHGRMPHPDGRQRGRPVVARQTADGRLLVGDQAAAHERQEGQEAAHRSM